MSSTAPDDRIRHERARRRVREIRAFHVHVAVFVAVIRRQGVGGTQDPGRIAATQARSSPGSMPARKILSKRRTTRTPRASRGADPLTRLRAICMALPGSVEKLSHGEPTWFAGKDKVFAMLDDHHHGAPHLSVWLPAPPGAQKALVQPEPTHYFRPAVGHRGWVGVVLDTKPDWHVVTELVADAYRLVTRRR